MRMTAGECELRRIADGGEHAAYHDIRKRILFDVYHPDMKYNPDHPDELSANNHAMGFFHQDRMVGVVRIDFMDGGRAAFRAVAIDAGCQNKGLGTVMLKLAEEYARAGGRTEILLHVNRKSANFYRRNGYRETADWGKKLDPSSLSFGKTLSA